MLELALLGIAGSMVHSFVDWLNVKVLENTALKGRGAFVFAVGLSLIAGTAKAVLDIHKADAAGMPVVFSLHEIAGYASVAFAASQAYYVLLVSLLKEKVGLDI